jgi:hypothetical protein
MSTFVEIAPAEYDANAFAGFNPLVADFEIANARALIWLSLLESLDPSARREHASDRPGVYDGNV